MLRHLADDGDFSMLIDDDGNRLVVCSKCKTLWTGKLSLTETPASANRARNMMAAGLKVRPSLLRTVGIDKEVMVHVNMK